MKLIDLIREMDAAGYGASVSFARAARLNLSTWEQIRQAYRRGRRRNLTLDTMERICRASGGRVSCIEDFLP